VRVHRRYARVTCFRCSLAAHSRFPASVVAASTRDVSAMSP
jgi:hypothetical protein